MLKKITKKKVIAGATAGLVAVAFALAWGLPAVLAASTIVGWSTGGGVTLDGSSTGEATVLVTASSDGIIDGVEGQFAKSESEGSNYFALANVSPATAIAGHTNINAAEGYFMFQESVNGINFSAGDALLTATYSVDAETPAGTYHLPITIESASRSYSEYEDDITLDATITVTREDPVVEKTEISIEGANVRSKTYDGTTAATVDGVTFAEVSLTPDDYKATAVFDSANVGERTTTVAVELTGEAAEQYKLKSSTFETTANISIAELSDASAKIPAQEYTGVALTPEVTVTATLNGEQVELTKGVDYGLNFGNMIEAGNYTVTISPTASGSNYHFNEFTETFTITKKVVTVDSVEVADKVYDGTSDAVANVVLSDGLVLDTDYTVAASYDSANAGDKVAEVKIALSNDAYKNYTFADEAQFVVRTGTAKITPLTLTSENTTAALVTDKYTYSGQENKPAATVKVKIGEDEYTLTAGEDYSIAYSEDTVNAGEKTATITGEGNYTGTLSALTYEVEAATVTGVSATIPAQEYTGVALTPEATVSVTFDGSTIALVEGTDYTLDYGALVNAGSYAVTIKPVASSNYELVAFTEDFVINPHALTSSDIELEYTTVRYNGEEQKPEVTVKIGDNIVNPSEYAVAYSSDVTGNDDTDTIVTVTVTANADANITGTADATYTITPREVLTIGGIADNQEITYTGAPVALAGELTVSENNDSITAADLTTTWYEADGNTEIDQPVKVGSYVVKYTYDGTNYKGSLVVGFSIEKADSPEPAEMTANLSVEAGTSLAEIAGTRTDGFNWNNATDAVLAGANNYGATYTYNNDTENYTTLDLSIPVYGLTRISVDTTVEGDGGEIAASANSVLEGDTITITITPEDGYTLGSITVNGDDYTNRVSANTLTLTAGASDLAVVATFVPVYEVIEGAEQVYTKGSDGATFRIDADYALFENGGVVYVDGEPVDESNYTSWSGSTYIKLSAAYMDTLSAGTHTLAVVLNNGGVATANFTVAESAETASTSTESTDSTSTSPDTGVFTGGAGGAVATSALIGVAVAGAAFYAGKKLISRK